MRHYKGSAWFTVPRASLSLYVQKTLIVIVIVVILSTKAVV